MGRESQKLQIGFTNTLTLITYIIILKLCCNGQTVTKTTDMNHKYTDTDYIHNHIKMMLQWVDSHTNYRQDSQIH